MTWIVTLLFAFVAEQALAGDLSSAGAFSGAGQAFGQGMMNLQSGLIQQGLMEERMKHELELERMRQEDELKMMELQYQQRRDREADMQRQSAINATARKTDEADASQRAKEE